MVEVYFRATPNPQAMKFVLTRQIAAEQAQFFSREECLRSPLAEKLFGFPWLKSVFIGPNFVTITKQDWVDWKLLTSPLCKLIGEHIEQGEPVLLKNKPEPLDATQSTAEKADKKAQSASADGVSAAARPAASLEAGSVAQQVQQVLIDEIRPALQMDGGDVEFVRLEASRLFIRLQGACVGCPSATLTLKSGIENHMRQRFSQITEVISV